MKKRRDGVSEGGREEGEREEADLVLVSERSPVTASRAVRSSTPFVRPMLRKRPPTAGSAPSPSLASPPSSTIHSDSGRAGRACMLSG